MRSQKGFRVYLHVACPTRSTIPDVISLIKAFEGSEKRQAVDQFNIYYQLLVP